MTAAIRRNILYQVLAQLGGRGLMLLAYMILARLLGPAAYGVFGYTLSTAQIIAGIFFDLGLLLIVTRDLSLGKDAVFGTGLRLKLLGAVAGSVALTLLVPLLGLPAGLAALLAGWAILNSFTEYHFSIFRAKNRMFGEAAAMVGQRVFLLLLLYGIHLGMFSGFGWEPLLSAGAALCVSGALGAGLVVWLARVTAPPLSTPTNGPAPWSRMRTLLHEAMPLIGVSMFVSISSKAGMVMLGILSTSEQVGYYAAPYRLLEASMLVPLLVVNAMYSRLSLAWKESPRFFYQSTKETVLAISCLGAAIGMGIFVLSNHIVLILFGTDFSPSAKILGLLACALVIGYPGYALTQILVILGRQRAYLRLVAMAACSNIALNLLLIPQWQAQGAVIATILTELLILVMAVRIVKCAVVERLRRSG